MKCQKDYREIYLIAAESISNKDGRFSCDAIERQENSAGALRLYQNVFFNGERSVSTNYVNEACNFSLIESTNFRVMLLCMMAACWEDFV